MKVVAIISPSPKTGKTTLSIAMAEALLDVVASTALLDISYNQRASQWGAAQPTTEFAVFSDKKAITGEPSVVVVDTPSAEVTDWLDDCPRPDLAIVIIVPSNGGFWHIEPAMSELETAGIRTALMIVRVPAGDSTAPALRDPLDQVFGVEIFGPEIPERQEMQAILAKNLPLTKVGYGSPSHQQLFRVAQGVKTLLGIDPPKTGH